MEYPDFDKYWLGEGESLGPKDRFIDPTHKSGKVPFERGVFDRDDEPVSLTVAEWEEIWFRLRRLSKSFHFPDNGLFVFGGLFFFHDESHGCLILEPQKLSDWREEPEDAARVLDDYATRIEEFLKESGLDLRFTVNRDYSMRICYYKS